MAQNGRLELKGTARSRAPEAQRTGAPDLRQVLQLTIAVRRSRSGRGESGYERAAKAPGSVPDRDVFASERGANQADIERVADYAQSHGLTVLSASAAERVVIVEGPVRAIEAAFSVKLELYQDQDQQYRSYEGNLSVPSSMAGVVEAVFGLDDRPVARRRHIAPVASLPIPQVVSAYRFPARATGRHQVVGIIELGGGFMSSDLTAAGIDPTRVTSVSIDGAVNDQAAEHASLEVTLDVMVVALAAPGARLNVYFTPNSDRGEFDAFRAAVHDGAVSIVSTSWGLPEAARSSDSIRALEGLFDDAAYLGTTICAPSGDDGSRDEADGHNVDYPASSPGVLGCGGTTLTLDAGGAIAAETVWNGGAGQATGGGFSTVFGRPGWQADLPAVPGAGSGRGVPDVASIASGVDAVFRGMAVSIGGTSAGPPLWAALMAVLNERLGRRIGYFNATLYQLASSFPGLLRDITDGYNDVTGADPPVFPAGVGWDPCTGLGTPDGDAILLALEIAQRRLTLRMMGPPYDECGVARVMPGEIARFSAWVDVEDAGWTYPFPATLPEGWSTSFQWSLEPHSGGTVASPLDEPWIEIRLASDPSPVRVTVLATVHAVEGSASRTITLTGHGTYLPEDNVSSRFRHFVCWMQQQLVIRPPWPIGDPAPRPGDPAARRLNQAELERIRDIADRLHEAADRILHDEHLLRAGSLEQSSQETVDSGTVNEPEWVERGATST